MNQTNSAPEPHIEVRLVALDRFSSKSTVRHWAQSGLLLSVVAANAYVVCARECDTAHLYVLLHMRLCDAQHGVVAPFARAPAPFRCPARPRYELMSITAKSQSEHTFAGAAKTSELHMVHKRLRGEPHVGVPTDLTEK